MTAAIATSSALVHATIPRSPQRGTRTNQLNILQASDGLYFGGRLRSTDSCAAIITFAFVYLDFRHCHSLLCEHSRVTLCYPKSQDYSKCGVVFGRLLRIWPSRQTSATETILTATPVLAPVRRLSPVRPSPARRKVARRPRNSSADIRIANK